MALSRFRRLTACWLLCSPFCLWADGEIDTDSATNAYVALALQANLKSAMRALTAAPGGDTNAVSELRKRFNDRFIRFCFLERPAAPTRRLTLVTRQHGRRIELVTIEGGRQDGNG